MATMNADGSIDTIRGDDIIFELQLTEDTVPDTPVDLTGYEIAAQVRTKPNGFVAIQFDVLSTNPIDGTSYDLADGKFMLYASHEVTETLRKEEYFWDLQLISGSGIVSTVIGPNSFTVQKDITLD